MSQRIDDTFARLRDEGRAAFIPYLCAGDPDPETSLAACRAAIEAGADILELGVPFSDPLADGLTNQLAAQRALEAGMTQEKVFDLVRAIREFSDLPIILYTYYNLIHSRGIDAYAAAAAAAGGDGLLTLDLPPEEAGQLNAASRERGLANIFIVAPTTPPQRMDIIAAAASGFLYYVSRTGVTGARAQLSSDLGEAVAQIKRHTRLPVVVGFGISTPEHVREVAAVADGAVVGSSIVNCIAENAGKPAEAVRALGDKVRWLAAGLR